MDLRADSGTLPTHTTVEGPAGEQELALSSIHCETESEGTILLQLLEFKTHLFEAVEELHIRRDAETRFEDQLSKLVLEKQELEWEKESLQHQIETVVNQHTESLTNVKKQFQAKIRNTEEEKWKYQVSAELKDKEINNLKEELKSLQLLKYNLEKKTSELEQKLALQSRSKDSQLNQLGEVEKRFSVLSRQCAMVKQAHEKLEQNVDEAMSINKKLSSANEKQEATIGLLKKELEEVSKQLVKAKMTSVTHDKPHSPIDKEHYMQQLHQKLITETEMNKKLCEENEAVRREKQEVLRSLQHAQHLLLSQTQTVSRVELELQTQREQNQALKQEHEMMREKSKTVEDNVAQLMERLAASKTSWDKEKTVFLDQIKNEQQDLQEVKEAYDALHQKHTELSSLAKVQAQQIYELEMRESSQVLSVSTLVFPTLVQAEESFNDPISSSELCSSGSLQHLASSLTKNPDCLEDTGAVTKLVATGANGGHEALNHDHQSQYKQRLNHSNTNNLLSLSSHSGTGIDTNILNKFPGNSNTSGNDPDVVSYSSLADNNLQIGSGASINVSSLGHMSDYGSVALVIKNENKEGNVAMNDKKCEGVDDWKQEQNNRKEEEGNTEQRWNREEILRGDVKEGGSTGEKRGTLMTQTTDRADRQEDNKGSVEDAGGTRNPETETRDRVEGERWRTDVVEERGKKAAHTSETPETQIPAQTIADTTIEKSNTQWVIDFMDTEPSLGVSEASDCSQSVSVTVIVNDADLSHVNKGWGISREEQSLPTLNSHNSKRVNYGLNCDIQEQNLYQDEVRSQDAESVNQLPNNFHQVSEKTTAEEKPCNKSAADYPTEFSEPLNQVSTLVTHTDDTVSIQELETNTAPIVCSDASDSKSYMKEKDEMCDTNVADETLLVRTLVASQSLPISQKISEQETGQRESLVTDDDGDSSAYRKSEEQSNVDIQESRTCKTVQELESEVESGSSQEYMTNDKIKGTQDAKTSKRETDLKRHKNDESAEAGCSKDYEQPLVKEMLLDNTDVSLLHSTKSYRSSFDWGSVHRKAAISKTKSDVLVLHQFVEETEQNTSWSAGNLRHPSSTVPMFLKSKHNKVPLVITRTSELLNVSSVSGTAAFLRRHQQGEWKAKGETCRETTAAEMESGASLLISSFPASTSSSTPGCSRAPTSAPGCISECDWEPSCSQEREDEQLSFRAQISKIEQFLKTERLCLPKRQRTDN